jgi:hypothetical protein
MDTKKKQQADVSHQKHTPGIVLHFNSGNKFPMYWIAHQTAD